MSNALALAPASPQLRGRPREFDVDDALDKAIRVFSERGYHATSIGDLTKATDLASGSLYKAFKDKRAIFLAAFDRYKQVRNGLLDAAVMPGTTGRDKVERMMAFYASASHGPEGRLGCMVVGCAAELAAFDIEVGDKVAASLETTRRLLARFIAEGQVDGSIAVHIDGETTSRLLLCVIQGMRVVGKSGRTQAEMAALIEIGLRVLA